MTDATPYVRTSDAAPLAAAVADGRLPVEATITGAPDIEGALPEGLRWGPAKILLPDHDLPSLQEIEELIGAARRRGRPVAVHCVTREALLLTIAALDTVGMRAGDRIEHGALDPRGDRCGAPRPTALRRHAAGVRLDPWRQLPP